MHARRRQAFMERLGPNAVAFIHGALIAELGRHGYELSPGSMYPLLHQLEEAGYLRRTDRIVNGKVRKYYAITRAGAGALADARRKIRELVGEVLAPRVTKRGAGVAASRSRAGMRRRAPTEES